MIAELWAKLWGYIVAAGAVVVAIGAAILYGREKGKEAMQPKVDAANANAEAATINEQHLETRHDTDAAVQALPEAPAQPLGTAVPGTAAGELSAWDRDGEAGPVQGMVSDPAKQSGRADGWDQ